MANHFRTDRVGMEIKREVNEILQKKVRDPRVKGVTITDVQMLGDLSVAKVYYTILSNLASDNQKSSNRAWKSNWYHQTWTWSQFEMYKIPDLTFVKDESIEYETRLTKCYAIWIRTRRGQPSFLLPSMIVAIWRYIYLIKIGLKICKFQIVWYDKVWYERKLEIQMAKQDIAMQVLEQVVKLPVVKLIVQNF